MKFSKFIPFLTMAVLLAGIGSSELRANTAAVSPSSAQGQLPLSGAPSSSDIGAGDLSVQILDVQNEVWLKREGALDFNSVQTGEGLRSGDTVKTGAGTCRLLIDEKASLYVGENTVLKVSEVIKNGDKNTDSTKLGLELGKLEIKLSKLRKGSTFEVVTPTAVAVVRGTTFFLNVGQFSGKPGTQLYVDESKGGVLFKNSISGKSFVVPAFSISTALQDGLIFSPKKLTPEQQKEFTENWQKGLNNLSQQFGIEEIPAAGRAAVPDFFENLAPVNNLPINDAFIDKVLEQNIAGVNGFVPQPTSPGIAGILPKEEEDKNEDSPPRDDSGTPPDDNSTPDDGAGSGAGTDTPQGLSVDEQQMILDEIDSIVAEQQFNFIDAGQARAADAQTGKVFVDVHGNRVRVDQYVFQSSDSSVSLLSLTQRSGSYENGISAVFFFTQFNRALTEGDGAIRNLPWNDYLNVVTPSQLTGFELPGPYEQYIIHEHSLSQDAPSLYPLMFGAVFTDSFQPDSAQATDLGVVMLAEQYSNPFRISSSESSFWAQGLEAKVTMAYQTSADFAFSAQTAFGGPPAALLNDNFDVAFSSRKGVQSAGLASNQTIALDTADGLNQLRSSGVGAAFMEEIYNQDHILYGVFIPVDDQGNIIDAPGFGIRGLRDIFNPNPLVNGGQYNLETIFVYGTLNESGAVQETFRTDSIITPEIFSNYGLKNPDGTRNNSTRFPAALEPDNSQNV